MINSLIQALKDFFGGLKPWVMVQPWELAIRARVGKHIKVLKPGIHLRIPFLDIINLQSIRRRVTSLGRQTLTTKCGKVVTLSVTVGYSISDLEKLYQTLHHAEDTIQNIVRGSVANYIASCELSNCNLREANQYITKSISMNQFGIKIEDINIVDFAAVKTYRLIGDYVGFSSSGGSLYTESLVRPSY